LNVKIHTIAGIINKMNRESAASVTGDAHKIYVCTPAEAAATLSAHDLPETAPTTGGTAYPFGRSGRRTALATVVTTVTVPRRLRRRRWWGTCAPSRLWLGPGVVVAAFSRPQSLHVVHTHSTSRDRRAKKKNNIQ